MINLAETYINMELILRILKVHKFSKLNKNSPLTFILEIKCSFDLQVAHMLFNENSKYKYWLNIAL